MGSIPDGTIADFPKPAPWFPSPPRPGAWKAQLQTIIALCLIVGGVAGLIAFAKNDMRTEAVICMAIAGGSMIWLPFTGVGVKRASNWRNGRILPARVLTPAVDTTSAADVAAAGLRMAGLGGGLMASSLGQRPGAPHATVEFIMSARAYVAPVPLEGDVRHWKLDNIVWIVIHKEVHALSSCSPAETQLAVPPDVELQLRQALRHLPRA